MQDRFCGADGQQMLADTGAVSFNFRPRGKHSALVIAFSLAVCLVGNSVRAQTGSRLNPGNHASDQASKRGKTSDPAAKLRSA